MSVGLSDEIDADWKKGRLGNDGIWKWIPSAPFSQPFFVSRYLELKFCYLTGFLRFRPTAAIPTKPVLKSSIVAGSGTGAALLVTQRMAIFRLMGTFFGSLSMFVGVAG